MAPPIAILIFQLITIFPLSLIQSMVHQTYVAASWACVGSNNIIKMSNFDNGFLCLWISSNHCNSLSWRFFCEINENKHRRISIKVQTWSFQCRVRLQNKRPDINNGQIRTRSLLFRMRLLYQWADLNVLKWLGNAGIQFDSLSKKNILSKGWLMQE